MASKIDFALGEVYFLKTIFILQTLSLFITSGNIFNSQDLKTLFVSPNLTKGTLYLNIQQFFYIKFIWWLGRSPIFLFSKC